MVTEWLTVTEAAKRTGIPAATIRWHCRMPQGEFHAACTRVGDQGIYLIPDDVLPRLTDRRPK